MPITFVTFSIGVLALTGFPLLAGFYSKDAILAVALEANAGAFYLLVFGAFLTAFYMTRLWLITFLGTPKSDHAEHAHENGLVMTLPLMLLAALSIIGGVAALYPDAVAGVIGSIPHPDEADHMTILIASLVAVFLGYGLSFVFYGIGAKEDRLERTVKPLHTLFAQKFYFDHVYDWYVAKIQQRIALTLHFIEQIVLSGLIVRGTAGIAGLVGIGLRSLHVGNIHAYVYWFIGGLALFWALAVGIF